MRWIKSLPTFIVVIILVVFVCGCGNEEEETQKRASASLTLVSKDGKEDSALDSGTSGNSVVVTDTPEDAETSPKNNYLITPVTEGLCEQLPASELGELAKYNAFNRLERNDKTELMLEHKVCVDDTTGIVYYVNVGRDYFLYRIKDGKSELVVELPANYLYTHEGVLYFLLDAQNIVEGYWENAVLGKYMYDKFTFEGMSEGDIYSYTPATGKVELVYPAQALRIKVTDEGICYLKGQLNKNEKNATELEWCYIPFNGGEPKKIEDGWMDDAIESISEISGTPSCIYENKIYAMDRNLTVFKSFDLLTKEELFAHNLEENISSTDWTPKDGANILRKLQSDSLRRMIEKGYVQSISFVLTEKCKLWFVVQQYIYQINLETGETQLFYYPSTAHLGSEHQLYSDGRNLYTLYYNDKKVREPVFMRLFFDYDETDGVWYWDVTDKIGVND